MYEWISWCQTTEDVRPTTYPTNIAIFVWLESGTGGDCLQAGRESDADDAALAAVKAAVRAYYAALDRR